MRDAGGEADTAGRKMRTVADDVRAAGDESSRTGGLLDGLRGHYQQLATSTDEFTARLRTGVSSLLDFGRGSRDAAEASDALTGARERAQRAANSAEAAENRLVAAKARAADVDRDVQTAEDALQTRRNIAQATADALAAREEHLNNLRANEPGNVRAIGEAERQLNGTREAAERDAGQLEDAENRLTRVRGQSASANATVLTAENALSKAKSDAGKAAKDLEDAERGGRDATDAAGRSASSASSGMGLLSRAFSMTTLVAGLAGPAVGLAGSAIAALPGVAGIAGGALGTLTIGMHGFTDAVGDPKTPADVKKQQQALAQLSPAARDAAVALNQSVVPAFHSLQTEVQNTMFTGMADQFRALVPLINGLKSPLDDIAGSLRMDFTAFTQVITSAQGMSQINTMLAGTTTFLQGLAPGITAFTQNFLQLGAVGAPILAQLGTVATQAAQGFGQMIAALPPGVLQASIQGLVQVLGALLNGLNPIIGMAIQLGAQLNGPLAVALTSLVNLIVSLGPALGSLGSIFLNLVTVLANALVPIINGLTPVFTALTPVINTIVTALVNFLGQAILPLVPVVNQLAGLLGGVLTQVLQALAPMFPTLVAVMGMLAGVIGQILPVVAQLVGMMIGALAPILPQIAGLFMQLVGALLPIIPPIMQLVSALIPPLAQMMGALAPVAMALAGAVVQVVQALVPMIPPILQLATTVLPPLVSLLAGFAAVLAGVLPGAIRIAADLISGLVRVIGGIVGAVAGAIGGVISWFADLPARIGAAVSAVGSFFASIPGAIGNALSAVGSFLANLPANIIYGLGYVAGAIIGFFIALPGRLASAFTALGSWIASTATNAWNGLTTGVSNAVTAVVGWFQALPGRIMAFLTALPGQLASFASTVWNGFVSGVSAGFNAVISWFQGLPGRITGFFAAAGTWLSNVGRDIWNGLLNGLSAAWGAVTSWIAGIVTDFVAGFEHGLGIASPSTIFHRIGGDILQGLINGLQALWGAVTGWFTGAAAWLGGVFTGAWEAIRNTAVSAWTGITSWLSGAVTAIVNFFQNAWNNEVQGWVNIWNTIRNTVTSVWNAVVSWLTGAINGFVSFWSNVWNNVSSFFSNIWNTIRAVVMAVWNYVQAWFQSELNAFFAFWSNIWNNVLAFFQNLWNNLRTWITNTWNTIHDWFVAALNAYYAFWSNIWNNILSFFQNVWNNLHDWIMSIWNTIKAWFQNELNLFVAIWSGIWDGIKQKFEDIWNGIKNTAQSIWDGIKGVIRDGVNAVIDGANWMVDQVNKVLGFLHIPLVPHIDRLEAGGILGLAAGGVLPPVTQSIVPQYAAGTGRIGGGFQTDGPMAIVGEGGPDPEYVIPTDPVYRQRALQLHAALGADLGVAPMVPVTGAAGPMMAAGGVMPLLADGGILGSVGGWLGDAAGWVGHAVSSAYNAVTGALGDVTQWIGGGIEGLKPQIEAAIESMLPDGFLKGAGKWIVDQAIPALEQMISQATAAMGAGPISGGAAPPGVINGWIMEALGILGWPANYAAGIYQQIMLESSGNPNAIQGNIGDINNITGDLAKGIMQVIGCVPLDTTILTRRGWLSHDEVQVGDETLGYNPETGRNEWTRIERVFHYDDAEVSRIGNRNWSARVTGNHRWWSEPHVDRTERDTVCPRCGREWPTERGMETHLGRAHHEKLPKARTTGGEFVTTDDLGHGDRVRVAAPADTDGIPGLTLTEAAVIGWLQGDGHIEPARTHGGVLMDNGAYDGSIYQAKPHMVTKLRALLATVPHGERTRDRGNPKHAPSTTFQLTRAYVTDLVKRSGFLDEDPSRWVLSLSPEQRAAWLAAIIDAEGNRQDGSARGWAEFVRITQVDGPLQDAIRLAVYLEGYRPSYSRLVPRSEKHSPAAHIGMCQPHVAPSMFHDPEPLGRETVWCVQTTLGTWTMLQDGVPILTGNSTFAANALPGHTNIFNPVDNIIAGARHAMSSYGPAWFNPGPQHSHGYDSGGMLPPGLSLAFNGTGGGEHAGILTTAQWAALQSTAAQAEQSGTVGGPRDVGPAIAAALNGLRIEGRLEIGADGFGELVDGRIRVATSSLASAVTAGVT